MPRVSPEILLNAFDLPPQAAVEYFREKGYTFSWDWEDTWQEAHAKAFTVAKAMRMDVLEDIREMVDKALAEGITFREFRKELEPRLKSKGWWGRKFISYPDGTVERILEGSPWRLRNIYRTNLQTAYMAGRYKGMRAVTKSRPYWQYIAVRDMRTRPSHAALNGKIFAHDDPFWNSHYPPNGWGCRCRVRSLSERGLERERKKGRDFESSAGRLSTEERLISKKTGELKEVKVYRDPLTGKKIAPDPGWSYNPGRAGFEPFVPRPVDPEDFVGGFKTVGTTFYKPPVEDLRTKPLRRDMLLQPHQASGMTEEEYVNTFLREFDAEIGRPVVFRDVINEPLVISEDLFRDRKTGKLKVFRADREVYLKLLADTIKDPSEIWLTWVKAGEQTRLCKRYIGLYKDEGGRVGGFVVFDKLDDAWLGTTAFSPEKLGYLDRQRNGTLLYTKK